MPATSWKRALTVATVLALAGSAGAATVGGPRQGAEPPRMGDLAFMAGCWEQRDAGAGKPRIVEHYTTPLANVMLGTTRYVEGDSATGFELTAIVRRGGEIALTPYPGGVASPHAFRLTRASPDQAVFEAPEHDFPKRIAYRRTARGDLEARIDGGEGSDAASTWTMAPTRCPEPSDVEAVGAGTER